MSKEKNPLVLLISQVSELVSKIQSHRKPLNEVSSEDLAKLEQLEKAMDAFVEINDIAAKESNIDFKKLRAELSKNPLSLKDKRLFDRAKSIEKDARQLHLELSRVASRGKNLSSENNSEKDAEEKKKIKTRQKRFKRLGGDGWMRL